MLKISRQGSALEIPRQPRRARSGRVTPNLINLNDFFSHMEKQNINQVVKRFSNAMKKKSVPFYTIGILARKNLIEVVVKRPEFHNNPKIFKKIPKTFEGLKVLVV